MSAQSSKIYAMVYNGTAEKTNGGLTKEDIKRVKNSDGTYRYVPKVKHDMGKKNLWIQAVKKARKELGLEHEFVLVTKKKFHAWTAGAKKAVGYDNSLSAAEKSRIAKDAEEKSNDLYALASEIYDEMK